jgi:hypothetical protein
MNKVIVQSYACTFNHDALELPAADRHPTTQYRKIQIKLLINRLNRTNNCIPNCDGFFIR